MLKFLAKKYYHILIVFVSYFLLNLLFREKLINWVFNTSSEESVTNADAYAKENFMRNCFSYSILITFLLAAIISIVLLFSKEGKGINRVVLISVPTLVVLLILAAMVNGVFS